MFGKSETNIEGPRYKAKWLEVTQLCVEAPELLKPSDRQMTWRADWSDKLSNDQVDRVAATLPSHQVDLLDEIFKGEEFEDKFWSFWTTGTWSQTRRVNKTYSQIQAKIVGAF